MQKKMRLPWALSQGFKLLANYSPLMIKSFNLGKVKNCILTREKQQQSHSLLHLLWLITIPISIIFCIFRESQCIFYLIYKGDTKTIMADWYIWYRWYGSTLDTCHLGAIIHEHLLNWYVCFKQVKLRLILDSNNFAVFHTPTSIEVGEGITAKFACEDFASSKVSRLHVLISQLIVALHLYGVRQVLTVFRYGSMVALVWLCGSLTIICT